VCFSEAARDAPRLTAVVVFPTPPFWLAMAITRAKRIPQIAARMYQSIFVTCNMFHVEQFRKTPMGMFHVEQIGYR
jgi:hypothetical protein